MKKQFIPLATALLCAFGPLLKAQDMDPSLLSQASPASIVKLQDVLSKVPLAKTTQSQLCQFFMREDSLQAAAIVKRMNKEQRNELNARMQKEFAGYFTSQELKTYYQKKAEEALDRTAALTRAYFKQEYGHVAGLPEQFVQAEKEKEKVLHSVTLLYPEDEQYAILKNGLDRYRKVMDSLNLYALAETQLAKNIQVLQAVKPLSTKQKAEIRTQFLEEVLHSGDYIFNNASKIALGNTLKDPAYFQALFSPEIKVKTNAVTDQRTKNYPDSVTKKVYPLIYQQQEALEAIAFINNKTVSDSLKTRVNKLYQPAIDSLLILYCQFGERSKFTVALENKQLLRLTELQQGNLVSKIFRMRREASGFIGQTKYTPFNYKSFESKHLQEILSDDQFYILMRIALKQKAIEQTEHQWKQLLSKGLVKESDRNKSLKPIYNYYLSREIANFRYTDDLERKNKNIGEIDSAKPEDLKKLDLVIKTGSADNTLKNNLAW